jgi:hypothetical protein
MSRASALVGALLWVALVQSPGVDLIHWLLLLGPLVAVPLGLGLIVAPVPSPLDVADASSAPAWLARLPSIELLVRWTQRAQPIGAAAALSAFFINGPPVIALVFMWLVVTLLVAVIGARRIIGRLATRSMGRLDELSIDMGLLYLPVGGAWLVASRLGLEPLGFSGDIVTLTGVHFHFAGFSAPLLVGLTGRIAQRADMPRARLASRIACCGAIAGPPLVAAGITFSRALELPGAAILATCLLTSAVLNITVVRPTWSSPAARGLLNFSSASLILTMALAVAYAYGRLIGSETFPISFMARYHGIGNALGFAVCGLTAWTLSTRTVARKD